MEDNLLEYQKLKDELEQACGLPAARSGAADDILRRARARTRMHAHTYARTRARPRMRGLTS